MTSGASSSPATSGGSWASWGGDAFEVCVGPDGVYFKKVNDNRDILHAVDALAEAVNDKDYDSSCYTRLAPIVRELRRALREIRDEKGGSV